MESYVKNEWGYSMFMSGLTNNKRGIMILLNNNFQHEVGRVVKDPNGNFLIMEITIKGKKITLANIYGPNEDRPQFYSMLRQKVEDLDNEMIIMCGDWNLIIDPEIDCENYKHVNNPKARAVVMEFLEDFEYMDAYRIINDDKKGFTWKKLNPGAQSCILQNGYLSESFMLQRGCRQGDPISPYIFILCVEILGKMIRDDKNLQGIKINNKEFKLCQYADDTQVFLDGSEKSLHHLMSILQRFYYMSGLKINEDKTNLRLYG